MDLGPGGLSNPGPSGFGGGYNATGTDYNASGGSNEPVMFPEQLNLPEPEAPRFAQTIQRAVDSPFGRGAEFAFKTALSSAFPAYGLITLAQNIYNAGGVNPYLQQQKETLQNFERRAPSSRRLLQSPELGNRQGSGHIQAYLLSNPRSIDSPLIG